MKQKPDLSFWKLWNLSFGFFGVQIAYALQSANISRIFATLGADPHNLSYFWILDVDPFRPSHTLFIYRCRSGCARDVPVAQLGIAGTDRECRHDLRSDSPHVPRHQHQHGDAAV